PMIAIEPDAISATLLSGQETSRPFVVSNPGSEPVDLDFSVEGIAAGGDTSLCESSAVWVLEAGTSLLARIGLNDGSVMRRGPEIFGSSALALDSRANIAYISSIQGDLWQLDTVTGERTRLDDGPGTITDIAL